MPYEAFYTRFPQVAAKETRTITVLNHASIPMGNYGLIEMYCNEPGCDCRRVFFNVYDSERDTSMAIIAYGWESEKFYTRWFRDNDPRMIRDLQGPVLNSGSPQSKYAPAFLALIEGILKDSNYVSRLKKHYQIFKEAVNHGKVQENDELTEEDILRAKAGEKTIQEAMKKTSRRRRVHRKR
jgi:hypothetical protein